MGKANSSSLADTIRDKMTRCGRASTVPSRLRETGGEIPPTGAEGGGRPPTGAGGGRRGGGRGGGGSSSDGARVQKLRSVLDIGGRPRTSSSSEVPSASGIMGDDDEREEDGEREDVEGEEEDDEREEVEGEEEDEEREEVEGEEDTVKKGWLRGVATLPRRHPATEVEKNLIIPSGIDTWDLPNGGRLPNGVITILPRDYWPGLFNPRPDANPRCEERVLALRWHHYEAARLADFGTHAKAVRDRFWEFYRVAEEDKAKANKVFEAAAAKQLRQMPYETHWVAITHFYHSIMHQKMSKKEARKERPQLTKEQYMAVIPGWCNGKDDAWAALVDMWLGEDADFAAKSKINRKNRGSDGTHSQGNRSHHLYKKHKESVLEKPLSHIEAWSCGRLRDSPQEGESIYYGNSEEHLSNYKASFSKRNVDADTMLANTNEVAMVMSGPGKPHGCSGVLYGVIEPTVSYVQLRGTSNTGSSGANPSRARPSPSVEQQAYFMYLNAYRQEVVDHDAKWTLLDEYRTQKMENMYLAMENGTRAPSMGPPPPNPGPAPVMLTFEEFLARGGDETTASGHGSNVGANPGDGTPPSRSPATPNS